VYAFFEIGDCQGADTQIAGDDGVGERLQPCAIAKTQVRLLA
jgi:hypothetical protein